MGDFHAQPTMPGLFAVFNERIAALERAAAAQAVVPQTRVFHNALQSIPNNTITTLAFNSERWDIGTPNNDMHDTTVNNSRLTCRVAGLYQINAHVEWATGVINTRRLCRLLLNGATEIARDESASGAVGGFVAHAVPTAYRLAFGDFVEVQVFQNTGGALDVLTNAPYSCDFEMHRIGA